MSEVVDDFKGTAFSRHCRIDVHINKHLETLVACPRPEHIQPHEIPAMRRGTRHKFPPLIKELFAIDSNQEMGNGFSSI